MCTVQVAPVWRLQRAHMPWSLWVTAVIRAIQSRHCAGDGVRRKSYSLLSWLLFEDCWFFKLHWAWPFYPSTCVQGHFPSVCTCISKPTHFFIFFKEQNSNFLKNPNSWISLWCDISVFFSSLSPSLSYKQTAFFYLKKVPATAVSHLSSNFLFSPFVTVYRTVGCPGVCIHVLSIYCQTPTACLCGKLAKTMERLCVTAQQESWQSHCYSDCRGHQTAHMLKVRQH